MISLRNNNQEWLSSGAKWISKRDVSGQNNLYLQFVHSFSCSQKEDITVYITAVSNYELMINGKMIGRGPAVSDQSYYYYDQYQIDNNLLRNGNNVIAVLLFHDGVNSHSEQGYVYGEPGLLVMVKGKHLKFVSDSSWKVKRSEVYTGITMESGNTLISRWGGYKEFYNGHKADNWAEPGYVHSDWANAIEIADAVSESFVQNLIELDTNGLDSNWVYPNRIVDIAANLGNVSISADSLPIPYTKNDILIEAGECGSMPSVTLDFGIMAVGYPEIAINGGPFVCEIWYGESLDLYRLDVIRFQGESVWHSYQRRAFRFVQLKFIAIESSVQIRYVRLEQSFYAYNSNGVVESSDKQINEIMEVSKYTQKLCTSHHFEDCPWRERALWVFDMRIMALTNYYIYGNPEIVSKCIRQMFALQRTDGSIPPAGPKNNNMFFIDFCLHLISTLREYYDYTGDVELLCELAPKLERLVSYIDSYVDNQGLLDSAHGKQPFLDWCRDLDKKGKSIILNSLYSRCLDDLICIYAVCNRDISKFVAARKRLKANINLWLFDEQKGVYRDTYYANELSKKVSIQSNYAAIYGGFVNREQMNELLSRTLALADHKVPFGPAFYLIIFDALAKAGKYAEILEHIKTYWGGMLDRGARTWWEVFDPVTPKYVYPHPFLGNTPTFEKDWIPVSTCHGWGSVPAYAIPHYILGVDLSMMHANIVRVNPNVPGYFKRFTYKLPLRGQLLWLEFYGDGKKYDIEIVEKPCDVEVKLIGERQLGSVTT